MRKFVIMLSAVMALTLAGCNCGVNLTERPENLQQSSTEVVSGHTEKTNYMQQIKLTQDEEFYLNAFAEGNRQNAVFQIITEDFTGFELKTYKFEDGQWIYTNNFFEGKIKDKETKLAVEYYFLPDINVAYNSGSLGGAFNDDTDTVDYSYSSHKSVRSRFEISGEETAFIAYRRIRAGDEGKVANTAAFANPDMLKDIDTDDEYYIVTISFYS